MQKKIFVLTGEPSGDKLAAKAISKLQKITNKQKQKTENYTLYLSYAKNMFNSFHSY